MRRLVADTEVPRDGTRRQEAIPWPVHAVGQPGNESGLDTGDAITPGTGHSITISVSLRDDTFVLDRHRAFDLP